MDKELSLVEKAKAIKRRTTLGAVDIERVALAIAYMHGDVTCSQGSQAIGIPSTSFHNWAGGEIHKAGIRGLIRIIVVPHSQNGDAHE